MTTSQATYCFACVSTAKARIQKCLC